MEDNKKLTITFVVPSLNLTGGIRVISIYASYLADRGHNVYVVSPNRKKTSLKKRIKSLLSGHGWSVSNQFSRSYFTNQKVKLIILNSHREVTSKDVPDADVIIASFWNTAEWVQEFPESKGIKVYFLQHYEVHPWLPIQRVKATFQNSFKKIVVSNWIKECLEKNENCMVDHLVLNGVNHLQFHAEPREKNEHLTVGFMYSPRQYKGCDMAIQAISQVRNQIPHLKLIVFASEAPREDFFKQSYIKIYVRPEQSDLRKIYAECDAWIFSSLKEGFGLPILEAMACRTPVIATPAGAAPSLVKQDNGILLNNFDVQELVNAILTINKLSNAEWQTLSENAYQVSLKNSWHSSSVAFELALEEYVNG